MAAFDANEFKKSVKSWIKDNPKGDVNELLDFCEERIPPSMFASYQWLVDQTIDWYKHILAHREATVPYSMEDESTAA